MYSYIADEMVACGIATSLESRQWQDENGKLVTEDESFGCKVTHDIEKPDLILVMDKVGGDTRFSRIKNNLAAYDATSQESLDKKVRWTIGIINCACS